MELKGGGRFGGFLARWQKFARFNRQIGRNIILVAVLVGLSPFAEAAGTNDVPPTSATPVCPVLNWTDDWLARADATRAEQPHWFPPIFTVSPNLQQVLRYDLMSESLAGGHTLNTYGSGKGVEFIPAEHIQFIVGVPSYQTQNASPHKNGWADETFLVKYRFAAANEEHGNYVLTGFLGLSVPSGSDNYTTHHFVFTPTAAFGKGWGDFNVQNTLSISVPDNEQGRNSLGTPVALNTTAQYHLAKIFWPEVEVNYTWWPDGTHEGLNQVFITPGLGLGQIPLWGRFRLMIGAACQVAVTDHPLYHRNLILTTRVRF